MKLKNKKDQSVDDSVLLRRRNKIITRGRRTWDPGRGHLGRRQEGEGKGRQDQVCEEAG